MLSLGPRQSLQIEPVRSYPAPRYPAATDPLDFDLRDPGGWPFRAAIATVMLAAFGSSACSATVETPAGAGEQEAPADTSYWPVVDIPEPPAEGPHREPPPEQVEQERPHRPPQNPLGYANGMFPPNNPWGKGTPGVIPEQVAVAAILDALASRGLELKTQVTYHEDGVAVELDGLVSKSGGPVVGFEFVNTWWHDGGVDNDDYQWPDDWTLDPDTDKYVPVIYVDDPKTLSAVEMAQLDADADTGKRYVALVNAMDSRFAYQTDELDEGFWEMFKVKNKSQEQAVEALVKAVHDFVDYLHDQGAL